MRPISFGCSRRVGRCRCDDLYGDREPALPLLLYGVRMVGHGGRARGLYPFAFGAGARLRHSEADSARARPGRSPRRHVE